MDKPPPFGEALKARRQELRLSLKEAAKVTGIQPSRLHDLEQGRSSTTGKPTSPSRSNIVAIARGFRIDEDFLFALAGRPDLAPESAEELQLVAHFRQLRKGHKSAVLALVSSLFAMDVGRSEAGT